jgi:glycosyltransferase involved in cell wall biosynthesis
MIPDKKHTRISAIIITQNEELSIAECLISLSWVDEIVVLDSGSTDKTKEICELHGAKFFTSTDWPGFGAQKNRALNLASGEWIISIDADERITSDLKNEIILNIKNNFTDTAFLIPRKSSFCGKFIKYSGWCPDYVLRLFPKKGSSFSCDIVHEKVLFNGKIKKINNPLIHNTYVSLEEALEKMNRYSTEGAKGYLSNNKKSSLKMSISAGIWAFIRTYFLKLGFLDGRMGLVLAIHIAESAYYKHLKLSFLRESTNYREQ